MSDGLVIVDKPAGLDVARRRRPDAPPRAHPPGRARRARSTRWPPGFSCSASTRPPACCTTSVLTDKAYTATIRLGQATVTDDAEGEVRVDRVGGRHRRGRGAGRHGAADRRRCCRCRVRSRRSRSTGQRAYQRVRDGEAVELPARPVTVARFEAVSFARPSADLLDVDVEVECSSGTYVRALARDLGAALGVGGHLTALRRTRVGPFTLAQAQTLDALAELDDPVTLPLADAVRAAMPVRQLDDDEARALSYGKSLERAGHRRHPRRDRARRHRGRPAARGRRARQAGAGVRRGRIGRARHGVRRRGSLSDASRG